MSDKTVGLMMHKAILWARVKGELEAMLHVEGHRRLLAESKVEDAHASRRYDLLSRAIKEFVHRVEEAGLQE